MFFRLVLVLLTLVPAAVSAADYVNADMANKDFSHKNLSHSSFVNSSFKGGSMQGADLRGSDCVNSNFTGVDLRGADFSGSSFTNCGLTGSITDETTKFDDVTLVNTELPGGKASVSAASPVPSNIVSHTVVGNPSSGGSMNIAVADANENVVVNMPGMNIVVGDTAKAGKGTRVEMPGMSVAVGEPAARELKTAKAIERELQKPMAKVDLTVNFAFDSDQILDAGHKQVYEIAQALASPALKGKAIRIEGHTDSDGTDAYNMDLSYRRAVSVMNALSGKYQLDTSALTVKGFGESQPVADNGTENGRALNRRVTLVNVASADKKSMDEIIER